ncbi:DUF2125 domain-containing protein [Paracoccus endophyticus]|uniref:DUF2125 domain-containing protein n=1 Tax=Paracoccus endophyticus TaxID=2233774 RepID=UPI000DD6A16C|nr:DUF2125 domain-containing protein [Paracoccus endophyticus]
MFLRMTSSAAALLALTAPAFADVTPAEVWQNWVAYYQANGYVVTEGSREQAGETLTIRDATLAYAAPGDEGAMTVTIPQVTLQATGDGRVRTTVAEQSRAIIRFRNDKDQPVTAEATATLKGAEVVTGGTAADMTHDGKAAEVLVALDRLVTPEGDKTVPLTLTLLNTTYRHRAVDGSSLAITASGATERVALAGTFTDEGPEMPGTTRFSVSFDGVQGSGQATIPKGVQMGAGGDMNAALKAGLDVAGTLTMAAMDLSFDHAGKDETGADQSVAGTTSGKGIDAAFGLSAGGISYQASGDALQASMTSGDLPVPLGYAINSVSTDIQVPVMQSDTPAPFKFAYSLGGLTLDDGIWGMLDPKGQLPRDPASLDIDVTGLVRVMADLFDPATLNASDDADDGAAADGGTQAPASGATGGTADGAAPDAAPGTQDGGAQDADGDDASSEPSPIQPTEVTINKLGVQALGARIDASGALAATAGGSMDQPVGTITARMEGLNALLDKAVAMGLVEQDQVAGYRMMLAAFAKPAPEGGDALVSEFEFKEGGQIFANGQQVQ